jgi:hypothetical protein
MPVNMELKQFEKPLLNILLTNSLVEIIVMQKLHQKMLKTWQIETNCKAKEFIVSRTSKDKESLFNP